ncbi:phosphoribosylaminoimidazolecarboxamide formyltransferase/IMP cyclohydrolase [Rhodomicrobium vannielii ATCC 17100]|uniref:Bifunctional purine biosynthesis protein PurH n=1 Tax=Rhodomicrobium vannielii (strain ATCC 17100 / DSM 162 / LMG 4299 / NCIMB 10020 / ATH 3.1.1) TaxID=648757 RepID=E3I4E8_RHOVT|nr:bifunctional phosphoribosylaminoimidazolecarboxamide formyltransferase/IMP cyclohydrolase [Rhodomicrobium vannielii]ADP70463.1 phosphoribosylaminoimidazolecarboxamide formyltransferase/IMP cyclohydrolase [Rhodomicrobium vannielii ATCC 17100]
MSAQSTKPQVFPVRRALISVSDKSNLAEFARKLDALGIEIVSTGGTAAFLRDNGIAVVSVSDVTKFPEILEGRVKTLHPAIHGGILANLEQSSAREALAQHNIAPIGLVVINLYPFEETLKKHAAHFDTMIENIDVGGPAMLRAAAKNHNCVTVVTDPDDYDAVAAELAGEARATSDATRRSLAAKAFARTAAYDTAIATWFAGQTGAAPSSCTITGTLKQSLRYGENPHQKAALYESADRSGPGIVGAEQVQGKELSYNNLTDADAAFELISEFPGAEPAVAIVKHANPCGVALGSSLVEAYSKALACDPVSAFGGIVALNGRLEEEAAREILKIFTEVVIVPDASDAARAAFAAKPNVRLLVTGGLLPVARQPYFRSVAGGFLVQDADVGGFEGKTLRTVTKREPSEAERANMVFAMRVTKHVKSNAIVFAKDGATLGIGAGQMSRVDSVRLAVWKAREAAEHAGKNPDEALKDTAVASDAFFPFADGLLAAADAGATSIIQPGGSMRDEEVIRAADERGLAMVFTGVRHFRH